jgi:hypothetical protein
MGGGSVSAREPPERSGKIFKFATYDIGHIAAEMEGRGLIGALNRMLLVQYFSAIEAYLSDRLIRLVLDDPKAMSALVKGNKEWVADKIEVVELASNPDAFRDWVHMRLRELMYHNFVKIDLVLPERPRLDHFSRRSDQENAYGVRAGAARLRPSLRTRSRRSGAIHKQNLTLRG